MAHAHPHVLPSSLQNPASPPPSTLTTSTLPPSKPPSISERRETTASHTLLPRAPSLPPPSPLALLPLPPEEATGLSSGARLRAAPSIANPNASTGQPNSSIDAVAVAAFPTPVSQVVTAAFGQPDSSETGLRARQKTRLQLRKAGFRAPLISARSVSPFSIHVSPGSEQAVDKNSGISYGSVLQEIHNSARRSGKGGNRRHISDIFREKDALNEAGRDGEREEEALLGAAQRSPTMTPRVEYLQGNTINDENTPPAEDSNRNLAYSKLNSWQSKDQRVRSKDGNWAVRRRPKERAPRTNTSQVTAYIESLEAEVASLQTRVTTLSSPTTVSAQSSRLRSMSTQNRNLLQEVDHWERHFEERVQDAVYERTTFEADLQRKIRELEEMMRERDERCMLLEEQIKESERRAKQAEEGEKALSRRVDMFGAMMAGSPSKDQMGGFEGWATAPATPLTKEHRDPQRTASRARSMLTPSFQARPTTIMSTRSLSPGRKRLSITTDDLGSWHQGIGIAEVIPENTVEDTLAAVAAESASASASDHPSSVTNSTRPTSMDFIELQSSSAASRPTSLLSNASFGASWGLPTSLGRAYTESSTMSGIAGQRSSQQPKRMRRFPSTSGGLKPLILPSTTPASVASPRSSRFPASPESQGFGSDASCLPSPLSPRLPDQAASPLRPVASDKELEQLKALRRLEGIEDDDTSLDQILSKSLAMTASPSVVNGVRLDQEMIDATPGPEATAFKGLDEDLISRPPSPACSETPRAGVKFRLTSDMPATHVQSSDDVLVLHNSIAGDGQKRPLPEVADDGTASSLAISYRLGGERTPAKQAEADNSQTGILGRLKELTGFMFSQRQESTLPQFRDGVRVPKAGSVARKALVRSVGRAARAIESFSPFRFGGLGWWLFGLLHQRNKHDKRTVQRSRQAAVTGGLFTDEELSVGLDGLSQRERERRLALDGPGECVVMRSEPSRLYMDEHTALIGLGLPFDTPVVTITEAHHFSPTKQASRLRELEAETSGRRRAYDAADRAIQVLMGQQRLCASCVEPVLRRKLRLWARLGLALVLAVGIAILEGPESVVGEKAEGEKAAER